MTYQRISLAFDGPVAVLRFNHPEVLNAVGVKMLAELQQAVREVADPANAARCLLITGEGRAFCSGANLADPDRPMTGGAGSAGDSLRGSYHPMLLALRDLDMPIVSAVNGAAAGIGMSFAIMADMVCASRSSAHAEPSPGSVCTAMKLASCTKKNGKSPSPHALRQSVIMAGKRTRY